jgi:hypothetical protein
VDKKISVGIAAGLAVCGTLLIAAGALKATGLL